VAVTLIGGGSRSGKTSFALRRAREYGAKLAYAATAEVLDEEMAARTAAHQSERGAEFVTIEEPLELARVLETGAAGFDAVVVDCLTLWLSNIMLAGGRDLPREVDRLVKAVSDCPGPLVIVTNEVGAGIVPENALAREFRDQAGWLNQRIAETAAEVYWMVFGCPVKVK